MGNRAKALVFMAGDATWASRFDPRAVVYRRLEQVVGTSDTLFPVPGPDLVFKVPSPGRYSASPSGIPRFLAMECNTYRLTSADHPGVRRAGPKRATPAAAPTNSPTAAVLPSGFQCRRLSPHALTTIDPILLCVAKDRR